MVILNIIYRTSKHCIHQFTTLRSKHKMANEVYFRHVGESNRFEVTFKIANESVNRQFNFKRLLTENINDFISRISTNVEKVINQKAKRRKISAEDKTEPLNIKLTQDGSVVDGSLKCKDAIFENNKDLVFNLLGQDYKVRVNPPWIDSLSLPQSLMVGSFCYPTKLEIIFGDKENSIFEWYKLERSSAEWIQINCNAKLLYLSEEFLNCKVKLRCIPGNGKIFGPEMEVMTNAMIKEGPVNCPFMLRHTYTTKTLPEGSFRVLSYNILAEVYAESATAKQELFPYCPPFALNIDYRKQLYIKEILGYNADIICLQEVDVRIFKNDLFPVLQDKGYEGVLTRKNGSVAEGIATFFYTSKFRLVEVKELIFSEKVDTDPIFSKVWNGVKDNEAFVNNFKERTTVFHAVVLESGDNTVVIGNTHLFFFPTADHVRLLQGAMATLYLEDMVKNLQNMGKKTTLLFCGDMNSTPDCALYSLMTKKIIPADLPDWCSDKSQVLKGFEITQPFEMKSAYGTPKFTNYTVGFAGCLDYIYYQSDVLKLLQKVPIPSEDDLKALTALPSPLFPSDHVALIADFQWV